MFCFHQAVAFEPRTSNMTENLMSSSVAYLIDSLLDVFAQLLNMVIRDLYSNRRSNAVRNTIDCSVD